MRFSKIRIERAGIILKERVGFVADHPRRQRRMVLVRHHFAEGVPELRRHRLLIVVVEDEPLAANFKTTGGGQDIALPSFAAAAGITARS